MRATGREENHGSMYSLYTVKGPRPDPIVTSLNVDGQMLQMEVDTGARPLPYAMRDMVDKELDRLLADDIIEPVQYSDWATPVVPVMKADKSVRLCGDFKLTVNQVAKLDRYPIPRIEDLYAQLGNGTSYTKLDMRHAYEQIELHPESRKYVTINTPRGTIYLQTPSLRSILSTGHLSANEGLFTQGHQKHYGVSR